MHLSSAEQRALSLSDYSGLILITLQVDDSAGFWSKAFFKMEEKYSILFCAKHLYIVAVGTSDRFNGTDFMLDGRSVGLHQGPRLSGFQYPENGPACESIRAKIQYVTPLLCPYLIVISQLLKSEISNHNNLIYRKPQKLLDYCLNT